MNNNCPPEQVIIDGIRHGVLPDDLKHHIKGCSQCTELVWTTRMMGQAAERIPVPELPKADELYKKVGKPVRPRTAVLMPIWVMHMVAGITTVLLTLAGLVTGREAIPKVLATLSESLGLAGASGMSRIIMGTVGAISLVVVATIPVLISILWFRDIWRERRLMH